MTKRLDEIKKRNLKGEHIIVIATVIAGLLALMFFRSYTA